MHLLPRRNPTLLDPAHVGAHTGWPLPFLRLLAMHFFVRHYSLIPGGRPELADEILVERNTA
jgi:hypothetical protein